MYTPSSRGSKRKADKNIDADFSNSSALRERKSLSQPPKSQKPEKRISEYSTLVTLVSPFGFQRGQQQYTPLSGHGEHPLEPAVCCLQCTAFATSFLLVSQTTSVAAAAPCMTTSYTTTKLSKRSMVVGQFSGADGRLPIRPRCRWVYE